MKCLMGAFAAFCLLFVTPVLAYEEDTHFTMPLTLCIAYEQYIWLSKESPYLTRAGNPAISTGRWHIEGLP